MLQVFILRAFNVIRYAPNRFTFNCWCSAATLKFTRAVFSRFFRLIGFYTRFQGGDYFYAYNGDTIRYRRAYVASRRFGGGWTFIEDYHVASFVCYVRGYIRDYVVTSNNINSVRIIIGHSKRASAERVGFLDGSAYANRQAIATSGSRDVGLILFRVFMDLYPSFKYHRFFTANNFRGNASRLCSITGVLTFRFLGFVYCRSFMASVGTVCFRTIVSNEAYSYAGNDVRSQDVSSENWGAGAFGHSRGCPFWCFCITGLAGCRLSGSGFLFFVNLFFIWSYFFAFFRRPFKNKDHSAGTSKASILRRIPICFFQLIGRM